MLTPKKKLKSEPTKTAESSHKSKSLSQIISTQMIAEIITASNKARKSSELSE